MSYTISALNDFNIRKAPTLKGKPERFTSTLEVERLGDLKQSEGYLWLPVQVGQEWRYVAYQQLNKPKPRVLVIPHGFLNEGKMPFLIHGKVNDYDNARFRWYKDALWAIAGLDGQALEWIDKGDPRLPSGGYPELEGKRVPIIAYFDVVYGTAQAPIPLYLKLGQEQKAGGRFVLFIADSMERTEDNNHHQSQPARIIADVDADRLIKMFE